MYIDCQSKSKYKQWWQNPAYHCVEGAVELTQQHKVLSQIARARTSALLIYLHEQLSNAGDLNAE